MIKRKTVFIDRDGTINYDAGYINHPNSFRLYPFSAEAIRLLNVHGYLAIVITNQSGVGRGFFDIKMMEKIHLKMTSELAAKGAEIDAIYYCPHDLGSKEARYKIDCDCRKPKIAMFQQSFSEFEIDIKNSYMIGDKNSDIVAGHNAGCKTIMVKTGYGEGDLITKYNSWKIKPDSVADNLLDAAIQIIKSEK